MDTAQFLARLGPVHFIRVIWPKQRGAVPDGHQDSYSFYGPWNAEAAKKCATLNRLGYSVYYGSNDPGCDRFLEANVKKLRVIYRDCDTSEEPRSWELKDGSLVPPHIHYVTSPGKSQSVWLIEEIPSDHIGIIHNKMVEWSGHDASTSGAARLLRLPGFLNTKYDPAPLCEVVSVLDDARKPAAMVLRHFGIGAGIAGNASRLMQTVQSGSGGVATGTAVKYSLDQERAKRGASSPELDEQRLAKRLTGQKQNFRCDYLLRVLSLIDPHERAEWFKVGACLHFMFDGSSDGLDLWNAWSQLAPDKFQERENVSVWGNYQVDRDHPAHWGSLRAMAARLRKTPASHDRHEILKGYALLNLKERLSIQVIAFEWRKLIKIGENSSAADSGSIINAEQAIEHFYPSLHYDDFAREERTEHGPFSDHDEITLFAGAKKLSDDFRWTHADCRVAVKNFALENRCNPALDYMLARRGEWDGVDRLATLFIRHLGATDTEYVKEMTELHFIAMVRRVINPGCKYDYLPILQGPGELGKSSLFKRLMPFDDWFSDAPDLDEDAKRFYPAIQGKLCVEFAELSGKSRGDINRIKKIITQQSDEYIKMYGRQMTKQPRIAVFVGTTNDTKVLRDMTGNRRFPIIPVTKELNYALVDKERDQVWAEAVFREGLWNDLRLSSDSFREMEAGQRNAMDYEEGVEEFLDQIDELESGLVRPHTLRAFFGIKADEGRLSEAGKIKHALKQIKDQLATRGWKDTEKLVYINKKYPRGLYKRDLLGDIIEIVHDKDTGLHHEPQGINT